MDRESILATPDYRTTTITLPSPWDTVTLRTLGLRDRVELERQFGDITEGSIDGVIEGMTWVLVRCVIDDDGEPVFTDDDRDALEQRDGQIVQQIFTAWMEMTKAYQDELVGNSAGGPSLPSPTASPSSPA